MIIVESPIHVVEMAIHPSKTKELKGTEKRDALIAIEKKYQKIWATNGVFQSNAPSTAEFPLHTVSPDKLRHDVPKFFGTMAYPYMNGALHVGHSFSMSKIEFAAGVARMQGKRALFPMGFHCTGMPIKACADKLVHEIELFGKDFSGYTSSELATEQKKTSTQIQHEEVTKIVAKKGKAAAKAVNMKYQFQIMQALGIPIDQIHLFADSAHWLEFFPVLCQRDLTNFGCRIDWRRSFVTTDANPYYDSFVRWQMNRLKELNKIKFGKRYTVYSPKDGQPCMDHDRSEGEGVGPQEYIALKLRVLEWSPKAAELMARGKVPEDATVFFVPATLRPETMYGQTACFVGPTITYGVFKVTEKEFFIITDWAARNMSYQGIFGSNATVTKVAEVLGSECVGTLVKAPLSHCQNIRILPMETVLPTKGTGVVTAVPSDSPVDLVTITNLAKKADYYGIKKEWAEVPMVSVITTPSYGDLTAQFLVQKMKIASPKDTKQLEIAKDLAYKEGFYQGIQNFGDFKGEKVEVAKPKIRQQLIDSGEGFLYAEPERRVISRSGDECCVALMDQWYLDYGEASWKKTALEFVADGLKLYAQETQNALTGVLNWLNQWACARTYGLGSKLPWDSQFLVESLSDSTVYMAYYTVAHMLHGDIFGQTPGPLGIKPEQMTDDVWDYVFAQKEMSEHILSETKISKDSLDTMRREFEYWYPLDLRVSGKDLIPNHLTFFIYIHLAIFPPEYWPKGIRANGHLLLNGQKMAKSTGNFMTLEETVRKYGADATRVALADAGDGVTDANFDEDVADATILRLYTLREWCEEQVEKQSTLRIDAETSLYDKLFSNDMSILAVECCRHYEDTNYKLALKAALYDLTAARDSYRESCVAAGMAMRRDLVLQYIELQALLLAVVAPHWSEYIWVEVLGKSDTIQNAVFPTPLPSDPALTAQREYVRLTTSRITSTEAAQKKKKAKGKAICIDPKHPRKLTIYTAKTFPSWQEKYMDLLRECFEQGNQTIDEDGLTRQVLLMGEAKKAMPFVQGLKKRLVSGEQPAVIFDRKLAFDEVSTLHQILPALKKATGLAQIDIVEVDKSGEAADNGSSAVPGIPALFFENV